MQRLEKSFGEKYFSKSAQMAKLWQFSQRHRKPALSEKVQRGTKGYFSKIAKQVALPWKAQQHSGGNSIILWLLCKDWRRLWRKTSLQKCPNGQVNAIFARSPKPAFPETLQTGDQRKFFKNRPKSSPCLKGPKALWRKWHYPLISMHSKCKDWKRFWGKKTSPKVPEWPSYGNFRKVTQNPHFLKKCKWGTKGNVSKIPRK